MKVAAQVLTVLLLLVFFMAPVGSAGTSSPSAIIRQVFKAKAVTARCFAYRESRLEPRATHYNTNGTIDRGLFQINSVWVGTAVHYFARGQGVRIKSINATRLYDPLYNARVAWAISRGGTYWKAWGWVC